MASKFSPVCLEFLKAANIQLSSVRYIRNKHWDPKYKKQRAKKYLKIDLPDYDALRKQSKGQLTPEEMRAHLKKDGVAPSRTFNEKPIVITTTDTVFEPFLPPEGDGYRSTLSKEGVKQRFESVEKKTRSLASLRKIRKFDEDFDSGEFPVKAQDIYIDAHNLLIKEELEKLHDYVTENCYPEMVNGIETRTIRWKWHETLEIPRVVQVRAAPILAKSNMFGQITVRFHSRQSLAVYDRFGRLMYGNENLIKNVLEYVVFEKHLPNPYGRWRVHAKLTPPWTPPRDAVIKTFRKPDIVAPSEEYLKREREKQQIKEEDLKDDNEQSPNETETRPKGQLATA